MKKQELLNNLKEQIKFDLSLNETDIDAISMKNSGIIAKYISLLNEYTILHKKIEYNYNVLYKIKYEYYTGKSSPDVYKAKPFNIKVLKNEIDIYMNSDEDIINIKYDLDLYKSIITMIEATIKTLQSRPFEIKNIIEWRKFINGGY